MEYVRRAVNKDGYEMHDRLHGSDGGKTLCGKPLNEMWFFVGDSHRKKMDITCLKCKRKMTEAND